VARNEKRRQQALQRKAVKRKQKQPALSRAAAPLTESAGPRRLPASVGRWPVHECLITRDWQQPGALVQILVARRAPSGAIGAGVFLVDLGCLGVKNAFGRLFATRAEYAHLRAGMANRQPMTKADLNLVAKVIRDGLAYADRFGFKPHRDYYQAWPVLADAQPDAVAAEVPLGLEGKPYFVSGPYDNVPAILNRLTRAVGEGNFHFTIGIGGDMLDVTDEDEGVEDEESGDEDEGEAQARPSAPRGLPGLGRLLRNPFGR
jgi:hypothetical protein